MRRSPTESVAGLFAANSFGIAFRLIAERLWRRFASALIAFSLKAPGLYFGPGCRVMGGRCISFGGSVRASRDLWLEAVTSYQSQCFSPAITIGDHVSFSDRVHISAIHRIVIGNHVLMGSNIYIADHNHGIYKGDRQSRPDEPPSHRILGGGGQVEIGDNVWIGDNSVIVGPVSIGNGAIIGANSVVRGVVPANSVVAGSPARVIKLFDPVSGSWNRA